MNIKIYNVYICIYVHVILLGDPVSPVCQNLCAKVATAINHLSTLVWTMDHIFTSEF